MKRLYGTYEHQLDDKNRIRIPAKFLSVFEKEYENEPLYFVIYSPQRIAIMAESVLDKRMKILETISPLEEDAMNAVSRIYENMEEVNKDGQGRAVIPKGMRGEAQIQKDVVTIGMGDYIEIWSKELRGKIRSMSQSEANHTAYTKARELANRE